MKPYRPLWGAVRLPAFDGVSRPPQGPPDFRDVRHELRESTTPNLASEMMAHVRHGQNASKKIVEIIQIEYREIYTYVYKERERRERERGPY